MSNSKTRSLLGGITRGVILVLALALTIVPASLAPAAGNALIVNTRDGRVRGVPAAGVPGVAVFRGIPYAAPPLGALRWREPHPASPWHGVREPPAEIPGCMQTVVGSRLPWTAEYLHQGQVSEDCLFLTVWSADSHPGKSLPVLVYIYGGGFGEGSIAVPLYDGAALARKGAVVVEMSYRVGVLGFLAHPALTRESPHHASGNYGLLDQVAALRWVKDNVAAFGGDPNRVALFGQSAGAMSVYLLTASPLAKGLFQRAIVMSGPGALAPFGVSLNDMAKSRHEMEKQGESLAAALGAKSVAALREIDAQQFLTTPTIENASPLRFGPDVDGWLLPSELASIYAQHEESDVPMIIGTMADEASAFPDYAANAAELREKSVAGMDEVLAGRAAVGARAAYAYYFERAIPWPEHPEYRAFHSGELPYVFDNLRLLKRPWTDADRRLAEVVSSYWVNFAANGDPNGAGLPPWAPYGPGSRRFMIFGETIGARTVPPR